MRLMLFTVFIIFIFETCTSTFDIAPVIFFKVLSDSDTNIGQECIHQIFSLSSFICFSNSRLDISHLSSQKLSVQLSFYDYPKQWNILLSKMLQNSNNFVQKRSLYKNVSFLVGSERVHLLFLGDSPKTFIQNYIEKKIVQSSVLEITSYHSFISECKRDKKHFIHLFNKIEEDANIRWNLYTPRNTFVNSHSCAQQLDTLDGIHILEEGVYSPFQLIRFRYQNSQMEKFESFIACFFSENDFWICFLIEGISLSDEIKNFFKQVSLLEDNQKKISVEKGGDLLISEVLWMGSIDNSFKRHFFDEAFEIYNPSKNRISLSGLSLVCRTDFLNVSLIIPFSHFLVIEPLEYFVVTSHFAQHLTKVDFRTHYLGNSRSSFSSSIIECILWKGDYQNLNLSTDLSQHGLVVDTLGDGQHSWGDMADEYTSEYGFTSSISDFVFSVRSLERNINNLKTYTNNRPISQNRWVARSFEKHTFHSLGFENQYFHTPISDVPLIISEVLPKGTFHATNSYSGSDRQDVFIEFYNTGKYSILMNDIFFFVWNGVEILYNISFPFGFELESNHFFGIKRFGHRGISSDMLVDSSLHFSDKVTHVTLQNKQLDFDNILDQVGSSFSLLKDFSGFFYRKECDLINCASVRSIERNLLNFQRGDLSSSWHMNFFQNPSDGILFNYQLYTFATPMKKNSEQRGELLDTGKIIFSEVHWAGFRTKEGFYDKKDIFIELYNNSSSIVDLQFVQIQFLLKKNYGSHFLFEKSLLLDPYSFLVLYKKEDSHFNISRQHVFVSEMHLSSYAKKLQIVDAYGNIIDTLDRVRSWGGGTRSFPVRSLSYNMQTELWNSHLCTVKDLECVSPGE